MLLTEALLLGGQLLAPDGFGFAQLALRLKLACESTTPVVHGSSLEQVLPRGQFLAPTSSACSPAGLPRTTRFGEVRLGLVGEEFEGMKLSHMQRLLCCAGGHARQLGISRFP